MERQSGGRGKEGERAGREGREGNEGREGRLGREGERVEREDSLGLVDHIHAMQSCVSSTCPDDLVQNFDTMGMNTR